MTLPQENSLTQHGRRHILGVLRLGLGRSASSDSLRIPSSRVMLGPGIAQSGISELAEFGVDINPYFCKYRNMPETQTNRSTDQVAKYADMFSAMGTEPRLRIMQLLLSAHPEGLVVGEIQEALEIPNSTLSHHLEKLKSEDLVRVRRESTFLHYSANTEVLQELLQFLYAECCTRNNAVKPRSIMHVCR